LKQVRFAEFASPRGYGFDDERECDEDFAADFGVGAAEPAIEAAAAAGVAGWDNLFTSLAVSK
jgi:hypothetical protein